MKRTVFLSLVLIATEATASPPELEAGIWRCPVTESLRCDAGSPCVAGATNVIILVDARAGRFARCWNDLSDCDYYAARFWRRGEQLTALGLEDGNFMNLSPDLAVTEVSSIGHSVFIFRGRCVAAPANAQRGQRYLPSVGIVDPIRRNGAILLPESAVLSDGHGTFVYIIDGDNMVVRRDVTTRRTGDRGVAIVRGLTGDERVVHEAGAFLSPGETVRPERAQSGRQERQPR